MQSTINIGQTIPVAIAMNGIGNLYIAGSGGSMLEESPVYGNFGSVNIGSASPQPISMTFTFDTAGTLGSTAVLTQGATGLDFADAGSDTCTVNTEYSAGQTCAISVTFTPRSAGIRTGAAVLYDSTGNTIASAHVQGTGVGPQIAFLPGVLSTLGSGLHDPTGVAVDGSGNIYVADYENNAVKEIMAVNGNIPASPTIRTLGSGFNQPSGVALDGSGNLYVSDSGNSAVKEILAVNGGIPASPAIVILGSGFNTPHGVAVDQAGDVFVADSGNSALKEILAVNGSIPASPTVQTLESNFVVYYVAVDGSGNVYFTGYDSPVIELLAVNGSFPPSPTSEMFGSSLNFSTGLTLDGSGNVFVSNNQNSVSDIHAVNGSIPPSPMITTLNSAFLLPTGLAVDGSGNVYVADTQNNRIEKLDFSDPPSLTFASTALGSTSIDSPQTVTVENIGNATLTFPIPSTGDNPSIAANFALNDSGSSACPLLSSGSSAEETLAAGATCQLPISFTPTVAGALSGSLALADNNLNAAAPFYATQNIALNGTGTQATPAITWATPAAINFGTPLSVAQLNATSTVAGSFTYSPAAGALLSAGQQKLTATFTPTDTTDYATTTATMTLTVNQATPTITWSAPPAITYGTALGSAQLDATSTVAGKFNYSPAAGTVLGAGTQTLTVTFTPTDAADYATATATVTLTLTQATPTITWGSLAAINYGTALGSAQLNASSTVSGTFSYSPAAGTVLTAGTQTLTATFTPTDTTDYTPATATVTLTVNQATPTITWSVPAAITYGTALGASQLNATSTVAGSFTYSPAAGTVLTAGQQPLTVTLAPTDSTDYAPAAASVTLTVNQASPILTCATPNPIVYGTPISAAMFGCSANVPGTFFYTPVIGTVPTAGSNLITFAFTPTDTTDYSTASASVTLTVNKATPTISWLTPAAIKYGTPLSASQLNATSTVAGSFTYSPAVGAVLTAGQQPLTVTFMPTDSTDYTAAAASVTLAVNKVTPKIAWATPAAITYGTELSATQLDATASVPGTLVYSPTVGTLTAVGIDTLTVAFTPTDTTDYATATDTVMLKVNPAPSFTLVASPASLSVARGASGKTTISVTGQNGFTGSVTLAAPGLPSGVTASFATNPTTGSSALTLAASSSATVGSVTITVKGTSGSLTASTTIALTVSCTPTIITPYISINGGSTWTEESSATVNSPLTVVDLGPQPLSGGSWNWTGPNNYASTSRQINHIPLTVGIDSYVATYTNASGCKSTETFTITVK